MTPDEVEAETEYWAHQEAQVRDSGPEPARPARTPARLTTITLAGVTPLHIEQLTSKAALPVWPGLLTALVGEGESGKTWIAAHTAADTAAQGHPVLLLDGEMSAPTWQRRQHNMGAPKDDLHRIHYAELTADSANVHLVRNTIDALGVRLVIWDSALSLISRIARSENDNSEVSRVYDKLREIVRDGPAGLIVDHTARGSISMVSRGATAKFNSLDVSYGVRLTEGSTPGTREAWSSVISVEKDRHGILGDRTDREAMFTPLGAGALELSIALTDGCTSRFSGNPVAEAVARIARLDPAPTSANAAFQQIGGTRSVALAAFKKWTEA